MKKYILLFLLIASIANAQTKITELTEDSSPGTDSLTVCVDDPSGTPATKKCTLANILVDSNIPNGITIDLSALATALAANGANCSSGSAPLGVDASGAVESCFDVATQTELDAISLNSLTDIGTVSILAGKLLIADGTDYESVSMSGDVTITSAGVATVVADSISLTDLSDVNDATKTAGNIFIADGTEFESKAISGDATLTSAGVLEVTQADALESNGSNCSAGSYPLGVDASGAVESCTDATTEIDSLIATHAALTATHGVSGAIVGTTDSQTLTNKTISQDTNVVTADDVICVDCINQDEISVLGSTVATATAGKLLIADGTDFESIAMSGDCTITSAGVIDCVAAGGASSLADLSDVNSATATAGRMLIANGTKFDSVEMSGSCTIAANGAISCSGTPTDLDALTDVGTAAETAGLMLIADGTDYEGVAMSGDVTISTAGATTITANSVALGTDTTGNYALGVSEGGNATDVTCVDCLGEPEIGFVGTTVNTATAANLLIADGTDFESVALSGDVTITSAGVATIPTGSFSLTELSDVGTVAITAGQLLIADGTDYESVAMSGDTTITSAGVTTVVANSISLSDLSDVNSATVTSGNILIADGTDFEARSMSGSCTMTNEGVISCSGSATSLADLTDVNAATATAGNILVADGTDFESVAMSGSCTLASSGAISCSGGSSKFLHVIRPQQMKLHSGSPMAIDAGNANWRGLFDASTTETATSSIVLYPYGNGGFDGVAVYSMASATSGTVEFDVYIDCSSPGDSADIDTVSYGSANSFTETVPGTAGYPESIAVTTLSHDSCAQGDYMNIKVERDTVSDSATGDAELRAIYIYEP